MKKKILNISLLLAFLMLFMLFLNQFNFIIPESQSVNGKLFLSQDKNINNSYVVFEYNKEEYKNYTKGKLFLKKIGCNSGQYLEVTNNQVFCDGTIIATLLDKNKEGQILPKISFCGIIPNDKFFALGEHLYSYDSRYFGLVDKEQIKHTARRIF
ncbi:MAG: S26 family signal peptidase [Arcobacteraceae bacterium]